MSFARVLVTGGGGQLASDVESLLEGRAELRVPTIAELDVTDYPALADMFETFRPDLVVNCAAFHNVDVCEQEEDRAFEVNARAVKRMAQHASASDARLVHLSTNYVFDGARDEPYTEADAPNPRSAYAISKLAGEYAALAYYPRALVVRTAGLYGLRGSDSKGGNFIERVLGRARDEGEVRMVSDQRLTPTFTVDLAEAILRAAASDISGLLHLTNGGACSWYEFTLEIMGLAGESVPVEPVETAPRPGIADRPLNGVLASARAKGEEIPSLRDWREALHDHMTRAGLIASTQSGDRPG